LKQELDNSEDQSVEAAGIDAGKCCGSSGTEVDDEEKVRDRSSPFSATFQVEDPKKDSVQLNFLATRFITTYDTMRGMRKQIGKSAVTTVSA